MTLEQSWISFQQNFWAMEGQGSRFMLFMEFMGSNLDN
jgi:hypothetical protein